MSDNIGWVTAGGNAESTSNLLPTEAPRGAKIETSAHMEIQQRGGETRHIDNSSREYTANPFEVSPEDGVLASARTEGGGLIHNRPLSGKDRVTLPGGMATRVEVAVSLGYLQRNPDGSYSETPMAAAAAGGGGSGDNGDDEKEPAPAEFTIGDEGEKVMTEIVQSFQSGVTIAAMDEILQRGEVSSSRLAALASQAGLEPHEVAEKFNTAHAAFYDAATSRMETLGVTDEDAFEAFVKDHPQQYQAMVRGARDLVMSNSTKGLDAVADAFLERADHYMAEDVKDALEAAGYGHKPDGRGGLLVVLNGGAQVPFQVAVRQKIITFSR